MIIISNNYKERIKLKQTMLRQIIEKNDSDNNYYILNKIIDNTVITSKEIKFKTFIMKSNNTTSFVLYDADMNINEKVYIYINKYLDQMSINSKEQILHSLKLLFSYAEIIEKTPNDFDIHDLNGFESFLCGISNKNKNLEVKLKTIRNKRTVIKIIDNCRLFMKWCRYHNYHIFTSNKSIRNNQKYYSKQLPKYITIDEYNDIINCLNNSYLSEEEIIKFKCIIGLMFESGLRIGEVLGLTLEDLKLYKSKSGIDIGLICIRNRLTDTEKQLAKTALKVNCRENYNSQEYRTQNIGFQLAYCNRELYDLIIEYIDIAHSRLSHLPSYTKSRADNVLKTAEEFENHYIFLNDSLGSSINHKSVYKVIRELFESCNLEVDTKIKENNLCHRFRHGFIMKLLYVDKLPSEEVIKYSRHTNVLGLTPYNNLSDDDVALHYQKLEKFIKEESR